MAPSRAYVDVIEPSGFVRLQATVVSIPGVGSGQLVPTFIKIKLPVPYVFLVIPGWKHVCPNNADC